MPIESHNSCLSTTANDTWLDSTYDDDHTITTPKPTSSAVLASSR
jgi:hypothetical protein